MKALLMDGKAYSSLITYFRVCKWSRDELVRSGLFRKVGRLSGDVKSGLCLSEGCERTLLDAGCENRGATPDSKRKCYWNIDTFDFLDSLIEKKLEWIKRKEEEDMKSDTVVEPVKESPFVSTENIDKLVAVLSRIADGVEALVKAWEGRSE